MTCRIHPPFVSGGLSRLFLFAFLILVAVASCVEAFDYSCSNCVSPDCVCATVQPPGGLNATNVPQIVLLTFDDQVSTATYAVIQRIVTNHWNPNGTPIQATFYVKSDYNDYRLTQQLYAQGHEIAIHTMTHTTTTNTDIATWRREIYGCRKALSDLSQIPLGEIVGFRAPGLDYNHASFQALAEAGMEYDASISESLGGLSSSRSQMIWPYTFDNGVAQYTYKPPPTNSFPGLFEVPLWQTFDDAGNTLYTMDFADGMNSNDVLYNMKMNLLARYLGTRAPMGLFTHAYYVGEPGQGWRIDILNEFIRWAQSEPMLESNVWFVSTHAAVEYTRNPVVTAAAASFPPFVTTERTIPPVSMVVTCAWTSATDTVTFRTCAECPPVYPDPTCVFGSAIAVTGGVIETTIHEPHGSFYGAWLLVSNDTDRTIVDWEAEFRIFWGQVQYLVPGLYTTAVAGSGTRVYVRPYPTTRPLYPGEVETNYFWVTNTAGFTAFYDKKVTLYYLTNTQPTIASVVFVDTNQVATEWDNVAANYQLMFTTNQDFSNWQSIEVHGRTSMVTVLPPGTDRGYFKLKTQY